AVHGYVLDAGGGPVPGAVVRRGPIEAVTAADGAYELCIPVGGTTLRVGAEGYGTLTVMLSANNRVRRDFRLSPEGVILGRAVRADDGAPVPDAVVSILPPISPTGEVMAGGGAAARAVTDGDGRFRIDGLVPGR